MYFRVCSFTGIVQRALRSRRGFGTAYTYFVDCIYLQWQIFYASLHNFPMKRINDASK